MFQLGLVNKNLYFLVRVFFVQRANVDLAYKLLMTSKNISNLRVKQKNSLSTESNSNQGSDSDAKIHRLGKNTHIISSRKQPKIRIEQNIEDSLPSSPRALPGRRLLDVPYLGKKQEESQLLNTNNFEAMVKSNVGRESSHQSNSSSNQQPEDFNITKLLSCLGEDDKEANHNISQCSQQPINKAFFSKKSNTITTPVFKRQPPQQQKELLAVPRNNGQTNVKKYASLSKLPPDPQQSIVRIDLDELDESKGVLANPEVNTLQRSREITNLIKQAQKVPKLEIKEQRKSGHTKTEDKTNRMTLRDYIYKAQVSAKQALDGADQVEKENGNSKHLRKKISFGSPEYKSQKYGITHAKMNQILKEEISKEIQAAISALKRLQQKVKLAPVSETPSDEELLQLYNVRRELKSGINQQISVISGYFTGPSNRSLQKKGSREEEWVFRQI